MNIRMEPESDGLVSLYMQVQRIATVCDTLLRTRLQRQHSLCCHFEQLTWVRNVMVEIRGYRFPPFSNVFERSSGKTNTAEHYCLPQDTPSMGCF